MVSVQCVIRKQTIVTPAHLMVAHATRATQAMEYLATHARPALPTRSAMEQRRARMVQMIVKPVILRGSTVSLANQVSV